MYLFDLFVDFTKSFFPSKYKALNTCGGGSH